MSRKTNFSKRECPVCSSIFTPNWYQHKYCSPECVNKSYYKRHRDKQLSRDYQLKKVYGISEDEYKQLHREQKGLCAICNQPETHVHRKTNLITNLSVDHDHNTGTIRGLLCKKCNMALGLFKDNLEILERAVDYIQRTKELKAIKGEA